MISLMDSSYVVVGFELVTAGDRVDKGQRIRVGRCIRAELFHPDPRHILKFSALTCFVRGTLSHSGWE